MDEEMADIPDFDMEEILLALNPFIRSHAEGSKERELFTLAGIALCYIRDRVKKEDFDEYRKRFVPGYWPKFDIVREFATRQEADQWRASGQAKHRDRVKIAGKGYIFIEADGKLYLTISPLPEELNSPEWQDDSEDSEDDSE
jgi:hypothetical protein